MELLFHLGQNNHPMNSRTLLSVVVPVYNEADGIREFHARTVAVLESLVGMTYEILYVDDGSEDDSLGQLTKLAETDPNVLVVKFSRNFGHQVAITAGLDHAQGDAVVFIDADLQDPPELISQLVAQWRDGNDVVYGQRAVRQGDSAFKRATAAAFYRLMRRITNIDIPADTGDYRLISRRVADELRGLREKDRFMRGLVSWVGFRHARVVYDRDERFAGTTKYPVGKMVKFALDGVTSFSNAPLKLATWFGYAASVLSFLYLLTVLVQKIMGMTVQGWATIMVAMLFLGGVQLICLGILGEYIGRIFNEVKPRPVYIVDRVVNKRAKSAHLAEPAYAVPPKKAPDVE